MSDAKRTWQKKTVEMEVKPGVKSNCVLVKIVAKDGKLQKYVMKPVSEFWGEDDEKSTINW
jgi:hypothetical protein